ncbi:MAG: copper chaperone PCu(A)C [Betaproteobacteria bacterium]|nr:copper chaperone PCu(A)C [Betaproteobacteria bacterium]
MKLRLSMLLAAMLFAAHPAFAQVNIEEPWVRATVPEQKITGAFMKITSPVDAKLVGVRASLAGWAEIHEMAMIDDTMKMRQIPNLPLPAGTTVELKPGDFHVMLFELAAQAKEGDIVPLTLVIETDGKEETVEVNAVVRPLHKPAH